MANQNQQKGSQTQQPQKGSSQQQNQSDKSHQSGGRMNERTERTEQGSSTHKTNTQRK